MRGLPDTIGPELPAALTGYQLGQTAPSRRQAIRHQQRHARRRGRLRRVALSGRRGRLKPARGDQFGVTGGAESPQAAQDQQAGRVREAQHNLGHAQSHKNRAWYRRGFPLQPGPAHPLRATRRAIGSRPAPVYSPDMKARSGWARRPRAWPAACAVWVALAGCALQDRLVLSQSSAPPAQRQIELTGGQGACLIQAGQCLCTLDFPLPGARNGPPVFRIFAELPAEPMSAAHSVDPAGTARGFLVQEVGLRKGKTVFVQGTIRLRPLLWMPDRYQVEFDVLCDDQTSVRGSVTIREDERLVQEFRRRFAGDIAALTSTEVAGSAGPTAPTSAAALTEPRSQGAAEHAADEAEDMRPRFLEPPPPP